MKLLTKEIRRQLPPLGSQDAKGDAAIVQVKFFTPWTNWTWYVLEASAVLEDGTELPLADSDPARETDVLCYGLVDGNECELGHFALRELEAIRGLAGLRIERDLHWRPQPLSEVRAALVRTH